MNSSPIHFISGLPRSGSTLLAALLRQNPRFHADIMSPVASMLNTLLGNFSAGSEFAPLINKQQRQAIFRGVFRNYYEVLPEKPVVFDNNRMWCSRLPLIADLFPDAKVIACVRNVAWIMDSLERKYQENPYENTRLFNDDVERNTIYSRVDTLGQRNRLVGFAWTALKEAYYSEYADRLLVVDYDLLSQAPAKVLPLIYQFLGETPFAHDFDQVEFDAPEFDTALGVSGLHRVRGKVAAIPRRSILPPDLFQNYANMAFWQSTEQSRANVITLKAPAL